MTNPVAPPTLLDALTDAGMNEIAARILEAAVVLFAEKGYAATSVREIVQAADVTNPMLYYYYESKEGVFKELISFLFGSINQNIASFLDKESTLQGRLHAIALAHVEAGRYTPQTLRFIYSVLFGPVQSSPPVDLISLIQRHHEQVRQAFQMAVDSGEFLPRQGFSVDFITEQFMGLVNTHMMGVLTIHDHYRDSPEYQDLLDEYLSEQALSRMFEFFFHGAGRLT